MPSIDDRDSLLLAAAGTIEEPRAEDRMALEALLAAAQRDLQAFVPRFRFRRADAEDLISEAVVTLMSKYADYDGSLPGFLALGRATLTNKALDRRRQIACARARQASEEDCSALSVRIDPLAGLESAAQAAFLMAGIPTLTVPQQLVVLLRLTNHEWPSVAWICSNEEGDEVTVDAARRRCAHAVEKLREAYERRSLRPMETSRQRSGHALSSVRFKVPFPIINLRSW